MNDNIGVFKNNAKVRSVKEAFKMHIDKINNFRSSPKSPILLITSIQGSGKTTASLETFAKSMDAILLVQSNAKIKEIIEILYNKYPNLKYKIIWGLEATCDEYHANIKELTDHVKNLRNANIKTDTIHSMIHKKYNSDPAKCTYSTQNKEMNGRIIETVARFQAQITEGKLKNNIEEGRLILIDEADGLLSFKTNHIDSFPENYKTEKIVCNNKFLPEIYDLQVPYGTRDILMGKYKILTAGLDLDNYEENIKVIQDTIETETLVAQGFYIRLDLKSTHLDNKLNFNYTYNLAELPTIFFIFQFVLKHKLKLILGSATLRHNRINFEILQNYFNLALELEKTRTLNKLMHMQEHNVKYSMLMHKADYFSYLLKLKPVEEFKCDFLPAKQMEILVMQSSRKITNLHSYSNSHYKKPKTKEEKHNMWKDEIKPEIKTALNLYYVIYGHDPKKILLITFKSLNLIIEDEINRAKKNYNLSHDPVLKRIKLNADFFTNEMHGTNADKEGYDLILTIGDPLDPIVSNYAKNNNMVEIDPSGKVKNPRGFTLKPGINETLLVTESMVSELLEAFHRGRWSIPIIAIGNFLTDNNEDSYKILKNIMAGDGFKIVNGILAWKQIADNKYRVQKNYTEIPRNISSLHDDLNFVNFQKW